jgi:hypothetical protein
MNQQEVHYVVVGRCGCEIPFTLPAQLTAEQITANSCAVSHLKCAACVKAAYALQVSWWGINPESLAKTFRTE